MSDLSLERCEMAFECPSCSRPALEIGGVIELPPDSRSDEISLQTVECQSCGFVALAVYEESRRGASESWDHAGYGVDERERLRAVEAMMACPTPGMARCTCASHRELGRTDAQGRWDGLEGSRVRGTSPMRRA